MYVFGLDIFVNETVCDSQSVTHFSLNRVESMLIAKYMVTTAELYITLLCNPDGLFADN